MSGRGWDTSGSTPLGHPFGTPWSISQPQHAPARKSLEARVTCRQSSVKACLLRRHWAGWVTEAVH